MPYSMMTPTLYSQSGNKAEPLKLLELGQDDRGKFARVEFDDDCTRKLYLLTQRDAWSNLFDTIEIGYKPPRRCYSDYLVLDHFYGIKTRRREDGKLVRRGYLSFETIFLSRNGQRIGYDMFDVPAETYSAGIVTGMRAFRELVALLQIPGASTWVDTSGICERIAIIEQEESTSWRDWNRNGSLGRRHAGFAFMCELERCFTKAVQHEDINDLTTRIRTAEATAALIAEEQAAKPVRKVKRRDKAVDQSAAVTSLAEHKSRRADAATTAEVASRKAA